MIGGFHPTEVDQHIRDLVNHHSHAIAVKAGHHGTQHHDHNYEVEKAWVQVVAGKNYFIWIKGSHHTKLSVTFYVPLPHTGLPAELADVHEGHI